MRNKILEAAIGRTIDETQRERERQRASGENNPTILVGMDNYRRSQEALASRQGSSARELVSGIVGPVSYILAPVILVGALIYFGCRGAVNCLKRGPDRR